MPQRCCTSAEDRSMQFHLLAFEGPDDYARAGGVASRVSGLADALAEAGFETHLWFIGDPDLPGHESRGLLQLHRWCQWISHYHPAGVYAGEEGKRADYAASLPPFLLREVLLPELQAGGQAVVLAEEWHTVDAVLHLNWLLQQAQVRDHVTVFWNANNTFGFDRIDWGRLSRAATITTVSRYMKQRMQGLGVMPLVIPNGLAPEALTPPEREAVTAFRACLRQRTVVSKVARWDPDKRWLLAVDTVGAMKPLGWQPLLIARGGVEAHGQEVLTAATARGLRVVERRLPEPGVRGLLQAMDGLGDVDVVSLRSPLDAAGRRVLFKGSDAVLANSEHEPFGLVGLETMAVGGLACTGCSGEDYAVPGYNALVLETTDPREFIGLFGTLRVDEARASALRRAGRLTARRYAWPQILQHILLPRLRLSTPHRTSAPAERPGQQGLAPMHVCIEAKRFHVAPPLAGWIAERLEALQMQFRHIQYAHVMLQKDECQCQGRHEVHVRLTVSGKTLEASDTAKSRCETTRAAMSAIEQALLKLQPQS
jgi:ribosome-associated translation inhibitor RaiA